MEEKRKRLEFELMPALASCPGLPSCDCDMLLCDDHKDVKRALVKALDLAECEAKRADAAEEDYRRKDAHHNACIDQRAAAIRERDELKRIVDLVSSDNVDRERMTAAALMKKLMEVERERDEARKDAAEWELESVEHQACAAHAEAQAVAMRAALEAVRKDLKCCCDDMSCHFCIVTAALQSDVGAAVMEFIESISHHVDHCATCKDERCPHDDDPPSYTETHALAKLREKGIPL